MTLFCRYDYANTQAGRPGRLRRQPGLHPLPETVGLVYRPIPEVAIKADYRRHEFGAGPSYNEFAAALDLDVLAARGSRSLAQPAEQGEPLAMRTAIGGPSVALLAMVALAAGALGCDGSAIGSPCGGEMVCTDYWMQ